AGVCDVKNFIMRLMLVISAALSFGVFSAPAAAQESSPGGGNSFEDWVQWAFADESPDNRQGLEEWKQTFSDPSGCWGCDLYSAMAKVTMDIGQRGEELFAKGAMSAMNAFMGLWVVW